MHAEPDPIEHRRGHKVVVAPPYLLLPCFYMSLKTCDDKHPLIAHGEDVCPACELRARADTIQATLDERAQEVADLNIKLLNQENTP